MLSVESVFEIIAEPNRRAILSLLASSQQSVGEIERQLQMPQPTVSKHLRVLREAPQDRTAYVLINNHLEGHSPGTIGEIQAELWGPAGSTGPSSRRGTPGPGQPR